MASISPKSEIHKWHFAHVPQTIVQLNAWHQNNPRFVNSREKTPPKKTSNNEPGFIKGLLAWTKQPRSVRFRFQRVQPVQKFCHRLVHSHSAHDNSLLCDCQQIHLTQHGSGQSSKKWQQLCNWVFKISGCFRCYPSYPPKNNG